MERETNLRKRKPYVHSEAYADKKYMTDLKKAIEADQRHKMDPEEGIQYYENTLGGNWAYSYKYSVFCCDDGRIASRQKKVGLRPVHIQNNGYVQCGNTTAHKAIFDAFRGYIPVGYEIDHINNDKTDNRLENLQLLTHQQNIAKRNHAWKDKKGKDHPRSRGVVQIDPETGLEIATYESQIEAAAAVNGQQASISNCCNKKCDSYKGFIWMFKEN